MKYPKTTPPTQEKTYWSLDAEKDFIDNLSLHRRTGRTRMSLRQLLENYIEATAKRGEVWVPAALKYAQQRLKSLVGIVSVIVLALALSVLSVSAQPRLYAPDGKYLGRLSSNPLDYESTSNPLGPYGNPCSPESINNPLSPYGNPISPDSVNNSLSPGFGRGESRDDRE